VRAELQKQLYDKYPKIFCQKDLPKTETCMCWGIDCLDGWHWLIDNLCCAIQKYCDSHNEMARIRNKARQMETEDELQVEAVQVKEKFGGLRFYVNSADDEVYGMISLAEHMSYNICENCGSIENIQQTGGWIKSLCPKCFLVDSLPNPEG